jgi:hypothetical protein
MYHYFTIRDSAGVPGLLSETGCELRLDPVAAGRVWLFDYRKRDHGERARGRGVSRHHLSHREARRSLALVAELAGDWKEVYREHLEIGRTEVARIREVAVTETGGDNVGPPRYSRTSVRSSAR